MTAHRLLSLRVVPSVIAGGTALLVASSTTGITSAAEAPPNAVFADIALLDNVALIMNGSGFPIPSTDYMDAISARYINATLPGLPFAAQPQTPDLGGAADRVAQPVFFPGATSTAVFTPEGLYPGTGVKSLEFDPSVAQGRQILDSTILQQIAAGNNVIVSGQSQSDTISTLAMTDLATGHAGPGFGPSTPVPADRLAFELTGDPNNPNGGVLERFDGAAFPTLGITLNSGATPADTPYDTAIYTLEYDGFADYPRYPIDLLADINAVISTVTTHLTYPELTAEQIGSAIQLSTSAGYTGNTDYFIIPDHALPLLIPLQGIPLVGKPLADLLQPILTPLINVGYGDPDFGWSTAPANVPTEFGVLPGVGMLGKAVQEAVAAIPTGLHAVAADLEHPSLGSASPGLLSSLDLSDLNPTDIINKLTGDFETVYSSLLPTADIAVALGVSIPTYDAGLFVHGLEAGNLLDAFGEPLAATLGLGTFVGFFEVLNVLNAVTLGAITAAL